MTGRLPRDLVLPDEKPPDGGIRFAAGAFDGVATHHFGTREEQLREKQVQKALAAVLRTASEADLRHLVHLVTGESILPVIDPLLEIVRKGDRMPPARVRELGRVLVREAPDREVVKLGIALVGAAGGLDDAELLQTIGAHDEFTLFAALALAGIGGDTELLLWELAKRVTGWGRIQVVERLAEGATRSEVRAWFLREGFRNDVMYEYLAYACAMGGGLHVALEAADVDDELLIGASQILEALASGGPAQDLGDYPHASTVIRAWLTHLERRDLAIVHVNALDAVRRRDEVAPDLVARIDRLRLTEAVDALVRRGLESEDCTTFHLANRAAFERGIDTFALHEARVRGADPKTGDAPIFELMQVVSDETIDRALAAAATQIDLERIATGPADELGLGAGFEEHGKLDFVIQDLGAYPGKGVPFLLAGLRSPVVRNRHWSTRVLSTWGRDAWPDGVQAALEAAMRAELDEDLRARMERTAVGSPFEDDEALPEGLSAAD